MNYLNIDSYIAVGGIAGMRTNESAITATDKVDSSITADFLQQENYIPIPDSILSVIKVFPLTDKLTTNLFDVRYQLRLNDLYDFSSTSIIHYEMTMRHLDFLDHILVGEKPLRFNQHDNRLYVDMDWSLRATVGEYIIVECYRVLDPDVYTSVWGDWWLRQYTTQLIKRQWGENLKKFEGMQLPGGVQFNGQTIWSESEEEIKRLDFKN